MVGDNLRGPCCHWGIADVVMPLAIAFVCSFAGMHSLEAQSALAPQRCSGLESVRDSEEDASAILQGCINSTPAGGVLEIPAGNYTLAKSVRLAQGIILRTQGVLTGEPTCTRFNARPCATFRAAANLGDHNNSATANTQFPAVMFHNVSTPLGVTFDHIVLDARSAIRGASEGARCNAGNFSPTVFLVGDNIKIRKSVISNTFCGSHAIITAAVGLEITDSIFQNGGNHASRWADGLTVLEAENALVARNQFRNNTDIDLIFGKCKNCKIEFNRVTHSGEFSKSSFGGIMLHAWPNTSGDYTGTTVTDNYVDCGGLGCGQAFIVGSLGWYRTHVTKGFTFERNVAVNAPAGFVIGSDVENVLVGNNYVNRDVGKWKCGGVWSRTARQLYDYARAPGSGARFKSVSQQVGPDFYQPVSLEGFIPNTDGCSLSRGNLRAPAKATDAESLFLFIINDTYLELLGRLPTRTEVDTHLRRFTEGNLTETELRRAIFISLTELNPFITDRYRHILKRCPDAWEVAIWRDAVASGRLSRVEADNAIQQSPEAETARDKPTLTGACPSPIPKPSTLLPGQSVREGGRLQAFGKFPSCVFDAVMQNDGNFIIYRINRGSIWSTQTPRGRSNYRFTLQSDGNVVLYQGRGIPTWDSRTAGSSGSKLILQPDGNLVLYNQALEPVWASGSAVPGCL
jgi:hypothetical protein